MDYRGAMLRGSRGAAEAHRQLGLKAKIKEGMQQIDVFDCLRELNVMTLCRPLDGLLGAYTTIGSESGILISTNRRLPIQRFTAAHELGHYWLGHEESIDSEESISAIRNRSDVPLQEIEAEAFAAEFILPRTLVGYTIRRQNYASGDLKHPDTIYQLSLRLGASYSATRVALAAHRFISATESEAAKKVTPQQIKMRLLKEYGLPASHPDVFYIGESDNNAYMLSDKNDIMIVDLPSHTSAGYTWETLDRSGVLTILSDIYHTASMTQIGGVNRRVILAKGEDKTKLSMVEKRVWEIESEPNAKFDITFDFRGKESGLPRAFRQ